MPHISSKTQVPTSSRFKLIVFLIFIVEFKNFVGKKQKDFLREARCGRPNSHNKLVSQKSLTYWITATFKTLKYFSLYRLC